MANAPPARPQPLTSGPGRIPSAWVLNLDAELELECGGAYTPRRMGEAAARARKQAATALLGPEDILVGDRPQPGCAHGYLGRAWCPTRSALARLETAGAIVPEMPAQAVLKAVNDRRFALPLQARLGLAPRPVGDAATLEQMLNSAREGALLFKTPLGFAGRGQRCIRGQATADDRAWLHSALAKHGLVVEPFRQLSLEVSLHGWLSPAGALKRGRPCQQWCDPRGCWLRTEPLPEGALSHPQRRALRHALEQAAEALRAAGYHGPLGIDGYLWTSGSSTAMNPLSELNARFSMGYAMGMAEP